ncbi:MAG: hypothetical protein QXX17_01945 [Conexivisphaerales archaeon]
MRIKTSSALRDLDAWREKFVRRHERLQHVLILLMAMLGGSRKGMLLFAFIAPLPVLYSGPGVLLCLIVLGLMKCRLGSYKFANLFLSFFSRLF